MSDKPKVMKESKVPEVPPATSFRDIMRRNLSKQPGATRTLPVTPLVSDVTDWGPEGVNPTKPLPSDLGQTPEEQKENFLSWMMSDSPQSQAKPAFSTFREETQQVTTRGQGKSATLPATKVTPLMTSPPTRSSAPTTPEGLTPGGVPGPTPPPRKGRAKPRPSPKLTYDLETGTLRSDLTPGDQTAAFLDGIGSDVSSLSDSSSVVTLTSVDTISTAPSLSSDNRDSIELKDYRHLDVTLTPGIQPNLHGNQDGLHGNQHGLHGNSVQYDQSHVTTIQIGAEEPVEPSSGGFKDKYAHNWASIPVGGDEEFDDGEWGDDADMEPAVMEYKDIQVMLGHGGVSPHTEVPQGGHSPPPQTRVVSKGGDSPLRVFDSGMSSMDELEFPRQFSTSESGSESVTHSTAMEPIHIGQTSNEPVTQTLKEQHNNTEQTYKTQITVGEISASNSKGASSIPDVSSISNGNTRQVAPPSPTHQGETVPVSNASVTNTTAPPSDVTPIDLANDNKRDPGGDLQGNDLGDRKESVVDDFMASVLQGIPPPIFPGAESNGKSLK